MLEVEYLTDKQGQLKAVVVPIEFWRQLFPEEVSLDEMLERIEDYCLSKAMDKAKESPLLNREEALVYLEEE